MTLFRLYNNTIYIQAQKYQHKKYIPANFKVHTFKNDFHLTDQIGIQKIGGRSQGFSIIISHIGEKNYVFCGDECYVKARFENQVPTGASYRPEISECFIKEYSGTDSVPLPFHDPNILKGLVGYEVILDNSQDIPNRYNGNKSHQDPQGLFFGKFIFKQPNSGYAS